MGGAVPGESTVSPELHAACTVGARACVCARNVTMPSTQGEGRMSQVRGQPEKWAEPRVLLWGGCCPGDHGMWDAVTMGVLGSDQGGVGE